MVLQFMSENTETYVVRSIREIKIHVYRKRQTSDLSQGHPTSISENICSEDDLRSRIFGTFVVKFPFCLHLLRFSNILKMG